MSVVISDSIKNAINVDTNLEVKFERNKDNILIPKINDKYLHSKYSPFRFDDNIIQNRDPNKTVIIALGFGAGYHLVELSKKFHIIAISENPNFTKYILSIININLFFNNITICTMNELENHYDFSKYETYIPIVDHGIYNIFKIEVDEISNYLKNNFNKIIINNKTKKHFSKLWKKNSLINLMNYQSYNFNPLKINKKAIMITGAGPSLEKSIDMIKANINNLFIASTDTSFQILIENNIIPDCVFSIDSSYLTNYHYLYNHKNIKTRLFIDYTSKNINCNLNKTLLFSSFPMIDLILYDLYKDSYQEYLEKLFRINTESGNIGSIIIDFFKKNTFLPLISVGIDFGYSNKKTYSKGSYIDKYSISNSNYFKSPDFFQTSILYKYSLIKNDLSNWETNSLLTHYSRFKQNVFTISDSPFVSFEKIDDLTKFLTTLQFQNNIIKFYQFDNEVINKNIELNFNKYLNYEFE